MKLLKNYNKYILAYIFFLMLCFKYSKCIDCSVCHSSDGISCIDSSNAPCDSNCKPKYGTIYCYDCSSIITGKYYTISSDNCLNQCQGDKILGDSGECTYETPTSDFKKIGDVYYLSTSSALTSMSCTSNICSCNAFFYLEILNGKKIYNCFDSLYEARESNYQYYNYKTKEFFEVGCPNGFNIQKKIEVTGTLQVIRCSDKCLNQEYLISIEDANGFTEDYCSDNCNGNSYNNDYKYEYLDNGIKKCVNNCPLNLYLKDNRFCLSLDECDYYEGTTCYSNNCPSTSPYHNYGQKECILNCPSLEYIYKTESDDKVCYRKEDCNFVIESTKTCLPSCESLGQYHDDNSKSCKSLCGLDDSNKKYYANNGHICYSSCSEIPGEYIYEDADDANGNKICYREDEKPNCAAFYKKVNGILKCTTINYCVTTLHKNYLINDECKDNCEGYYQIEITTDITYIKCFPTLDEALTDSYVNFCDTNQRKCWTTFPDINSYFIKSAFTSPANKYEIVRKCENFYYQKANPIVSGDNCYWCTNKCKNSDTNLFFVSDNQKCINSCNEINKYYYDDNNECIDSCELRPTKPYSYPVIGTTPKNCRDSCNQNEFHNYNSHICLSSCDVNGNIFLYYKKTTGID